MHERAFKGMAMAKEQGNSESSLPDDLIESILGLLPLKSKLICRCVCRSWNSILSKDKILLHTTNPRNRNSGYSNACLLLTTKGPFAYTLDPSSNIWHKLPKPAYPGASVLAATHGLVCIGNQVSECRSLIIFNLRCNTWKLLPNMLHVGFLHKVTMAMDPSTGAYAVVVTGEDISDFRGRRVYRLRTEVYDSVLGSWHMAGDALPEAKFGSDPGVWCDGLFYCITLLPYGLTVFNLSMGQWMELSVEMPKGIEVPSLVSCKGQLMMVGIQEDVQAVFNESVLPSESRNPVVSVRTRLRLPRSWSWSGPLQMWASSQLRSTLAAWPSIMTWTAPSTPPVSSMPPSSSSSSSLSSLLSLPSRSLSMSPLSSPTSSHCPSPSSPSSPSLPSPSSPKRFVRIWKLVQGKQWKLLDQMPEDFGTEFMSHLTPRTALVSAGVGEEVCITSHQSPNAVVFDVSGRGWRYAASDPLFPRNRDAHLLGFTVEPDSTCVP